MKKPKRMTSYGGLVRYYDEGSKSGYESFLQVSAYTEPEARNKMLDGALKTSACTGVSIIWSGTMAEARAIDEQETVSMNVQERVTDAMKRGVLKITAKILKRKYKSRNGTQLALVPEDTTISEEGVFKYIGEEKARVTTSYVNYQNMLTVEMMEKAAVTGTYTKGDGL